MPWPDAVGICAIVADAIARAHAAGVLHRDLKPGNILLSPDGEPLVADFGIATLTDADATTTGSITLTPAFTSPEALRGKSSTPLHDVYGLGATLYTLLTGHPPFVDDVPDGDLPALMAAVIEQPVFEEHEPDVPEQVVGIVQRLMAKAPEDRPTSLAVVAEDLRSLLPDGTDAAPASFVDTLDRSPQLPAARGRRRALAMIAAAFALAGSLALVVWWTTGNDDTANPATAEDEQAEKEPAPAEELPTVWTYEADSPTAMDPAIDLDSGLMLVAEDRRVTALEIGSGEPRWSVDFVGRDLQTFTTNAVGVVVERDPNEDPLLTGLDLTTRRSLWSKHVSEIIGDSAVDAPPGFDLTVTVAGGRVLLSGGWIQFSGFSVVALDAGTGSSVWTGTQDDLLHASETVSLLNSAFGADDEGLTLVVELTGVNTGSGGELWNESMSIEDPGTLHPLDDNYAFASRADPHLDVWLTVEDGDLVFRDLAGFETLSQHPLSEGDAVPVWNADAVISDDLVITPSSPYTRPVTSDEPTRPLPTSLSTEGVVAYDLNSGDPAWYVDICPAARADSLLPANCGDVEVLTAEKTAVVSVQSEIHTLDVSTGNRLASRVFETDFIRLVGTTRDGSAVFIAYGTGDHIEIARLDLGGLAA